MTDLEDVHLLLQSLTGSDIYFGCCGGCSRKFLQQGLVLIKLLLQRLKAKKIRRIQDNYKLTIPQRINLGNLVYHNIILLYIT